MWWHCNRWRSSNYCSNCGTARTPAYLYPPPVWYPVPVYPQPYYPAPRPWLGRLDLTR